MFDLLISIPGPLFIFIYIIYSILVIYLIKRYVSKDHTLNYEIPEVTKLDPLDIAYLNKGINGVIVTAVFNLWRDKALDITSKNDDVLLERTESKHQGKNQVETIIYQNINEPKSFRDLYKKDIAEPVADALRPNINRLEDKKLLPDSDTGNRYKMGRLIGALFLIGFGGLKLYFGIVRDKPVGILVCLLIISLLILLFMINPAKVKTSALGKKVLETARQRFAWLKNDENPEALFHSNNLLYGIAVFGVTPFLSTSLAPLFGNFGMIGQDVSSAGSLSGGGCSDSGSGSDGGSDGGGGCGGCGGGGGD